MPVIPQIQWWETFKYVSPQVLQQAFRHPEKYLNHVCKIHKLNRLNCSMVFAGSTDQTSYSCHCKANVSLGFYNASTVNFTMRLKTNRHPNCHPCFIQDLSCNIQCCSVNINCTFKTCIVFLTVIYYSKMKAHALYY